jgi:UPF0176 protein
MKVRIREEIITLRAPEADPSRQAGTYVAPASSYMLSKGSESVFHLKGGILKYLEEVSPQDPRWNGECYVFDKRVAVGHGLQPGTWIACHGCGAPLNEAEARSDAYEAGVSCPYCIDELTEERARDLRGRHRAYMEAPSPSPAEG